MIIDERMASFLDSLDRGNTPFLDDLQQGNAFFRPAPPEILLRHGNSLLVFFKYLYELKHHPELETVVLPVGDGVTLSVRCRSREAGSRSQLRHP